MERSSETNTQVEIIQNGKEKIRVDNISYGRERATLDDTIRIDFPEYDTYIRAKFKEGVIQGKWHVSYKEDYSIALFSHILPVHVASCKLQRAFQNYI